MSSFLSSVEIFFLAMYDPYNLHHTTVVSVSASSPHAHLSVAHMIRLLKIYLSFNYMLSRPTSSLCSCTYISGTYDPLLWWTLNKPLRIYILVTRIGTKAPVWCLTCINYHLHLCMFLNGSYVYTCNLYISMSFMVLLSFFMTESFCTSNSNMNIFRYAERRGVNVLAEIDVPGHALSW